MGYVILTPYRERKLGTLLDVVALLQIDGDIEGR